MSVTKLTASVDVHQTLPDEPNDLGGLTSAQLKKTLDAPPNIIKDYLNDTLIPELDAEHLPYRYGWATTVKEAMEGLAAGVLPDDSVTAAMLKDNIIGLDKIAPSVYASQAEAEGGTENTKLLTPLRAAQAIASQGLKIQTGTLTNISTSATAALSGTVLCVLVRYAGTATDRAHTAVLFNGNTQPLFYTTGAPQIQYAAGLSGTTLTIAKTDEANTSYVFNYAAFYL